MTTLRVAYLLAAAGALALTACSKDKTSEETSAPPPAVVTEGDETQTTTSVEKWEPDSVGAKESADEKAIDDAIDPTLDDQIVQDVQEMPASSDLQPAAPVPPTLSDAEIARITEVVNSGEIQQAQVAKTKAKNKQVKGFADHMIKEHRKAKQEGAKIAKEEKLVTEDSAIADRDREGRGEHPQDTAQREGGAGVRQPLHRRPGRCAPEGLEPAR